jgi:hypothetical protein
MTRALATVAALSTLLASACAQEGADDRCDGAKCDSPDQRAGAQLCAAIRGNGQLITAHFASLARITEHYGLIDAAAGGSSGSITIFMTESIRKNQAVWDCGGEPCSERERAARAGLLLKSFPGYLAHLTTTEEAAAFFQLQPLAARVQTAGVESLLEEDVEAARAALESLLSSEDIRDLINPELLALVQNSPTPEFHIADIVEGIQKLGAFDVDSDRIFIRPGLISFEALGAKLGRAASFYAGYAPADNDRMGAWLDACAEPGLGKTWFEVAQAPMTTTAGETTCGAELDAMIGGFRAELLADEGAFRSRIDDRVGEVMPALISTSVLTGDSVAAFAEARKSYAAGAPTPLEVDFDDVKFGYFGNRADLDRVAENRAGFDDAKSARFLSLGEATWREALSYSPAEPGLARALELPSGDVSFGGWSDLHPTLVLENLGCEKVVYVTRAGDESGFAIGVAQMLGMDAATERALYDLDSDSAYARSVAAADASWCTDWNNQDALDLPGITADGYFAPMESADEFFTAGDNPYPNTAESVGLRGCTPGAPAAAE